MPQTRAPPLVPPLLIERLTLELRGGVYKGKPRLLVELFDDGHRVSKVWLSRDDPAARIAEVVQALSNSGVTEGDLTSDFKEAVLTLLTIDAARPPAAPADREDRDPSPGVDASPGMSSVQPGLFSPMDEVTAAFESAAGVALDAPVGTRRAEDRRRVDRFDASSSLEEGQLRRMQSRGVGQRRALSQGCLREECVRQRDELANEKRLREKYEGEQRRHAA
eukprot:3430586-Prymnesium_polylepis.1